MSRGARRELITPEGLRQDGRRSHEHRRVRVKLGFLAQNDGSCYMEQGSTRVVCTVNGPREATHQRGTFAARGATGTTGRDGAQVRCRLFFASFSTVERRVRTRLDRMSLAASAQLEQTLTAAILTDIYPPLTEITVCVHVLQSDGGFLATAINAACLALQDAGVAMQDFLVAASACLLLPQASSADRRSTVATTTAAAPVLQPVILWDPVRIEEAASVASITLSVFPRISKVVGVVFEGRCSVELASALSNAAGDGAAASLDSIEKLMKNYLASRSLSALQDL